MKNYIYIFMLFFCLQASAQVGVYTDNPDESSMLDISASDNHKGLLIPRMTTEQKVNIVKPAHGLLVYDTDQKCVSQNLGTPDVPEWICLIFTVKRFFYMPSINIETLTTGPAQKDLYAQYKKEYSNPMYASEGAPKEIPYFSSPTDLYYYVTYHNPDRIKINSISADGIMNYEIIKRADYDDYINIVFVVK